MAWLSRFAVADRRVDDLCLEPVLRRLEFLSGMARGDPTAGDSVDVRSLLGENTGGTTASDGLVDSSLIGIWARK